MKKKPKGPSLFGRPHSFDNGWYILRRYDVDFLMRGMTHRVRGGLFVDTVTFRSGHVLIGEEHAPDLDRGIALTKNYKQSVRNGVADIHHPAALSFGGALRELRPFTRWSILLYRPSPCPPWEHMPIKLCDCPTP